MSVTHALSWLISSRLELFFAMSNVPAWGAHPRCLLKNHVLFFMFSGTAGSLGATFEQLKRMSPRFPNYTHAPRKPIHVIHFVRFTYIALKTPHCVKSVTQVDLHRVGSDVGRLVANEQGSSGTQSLQYLTKHLS